MTGSNPAQPTSVAPSPADQWEARYGGADGYYYGTEPNDFLRSIVSDPVVDGASGRSGPPTALCLADGEGRNGVYLAQLGYAVTSVDLTQAGMDKAARLAADRGVSLTTVVADLAEFDLGEGQWDLIVSIFAHTPPPIRARVHAALERALRPGGRFVLEAYTPDQIGRGTGGPPVPEFTMTIDRLRTEVVGLDIEFELEIVRSVIEGPGHTGDGAVVQFIARKPG